MYTLYYCYDLGEVYVVYSVCSLLLPAWTQYVKETK